VQPASGSWWSFDERTHACPGYALLLRGRIGGEERDFSVRTLPGRRVRPGREEERVDVDVTIRATAVCCA
jgi:hypothetical protein